MAVLPDSDAAALINVVFNKRLIADGNVTAAHGIIPTSFTRFGARSNNDRGSAAGAAPSSDGNAPSIFTARTVANRNGVCDASTCTVAHGDGLLCVLGRRSVDTRRQ